MQSALVSTRKAAAWMTGWLSLMVVIAVAGREAARELAIFQIMEMRSLIGLLMLYPLLRAGGGLPSVRTTRLPQHALRNGVHYLAQYGWFAALTMIPLAQVVAIEFTMPIWAALLAVGFLHEHMNRWKALAILLGLLGVAMIVRPSGSSLTLSPEAVVASIAWDWASTEPANSSAHPHIARTFTFAFLCVLRAFAVKRSGRVSF